MKYILIPYIALGLVLSMAIGVEYICVGEEMFPDYFGSPFVFKKKSLATSMEYYYSVSGLLLNILIWSALLFLLRFLVVGSWLRTGSNTILKTFYKVGIGVLIAFATLSITIETIVVGSGFKEGQNYWYFELDKEAEKWGMECEGEILFFRM